MNRKPYLIGRYAAVCLTAVLVVATASARTVYDAGKALRQNFQNNATPVNPYTDENGGKWTYSSAAGVAPFTSLGNFASSYATIDNGQLQGWGDSSSPHLKVNITGHTLTSSSFMSGDCEPIEADELVIHPGQSGNTYMVLRFIAPEDGWYSAFASFHDTAKETTATASSGASVAITLGGNNVLARGIVSIEGATNSTKRFDFQMPVRYMTAGTEIRFAVGNNAGASGTVHASDATGVKVFVTKEDEGAFFDSGLAMATNLASRYENPFGDIANGMWYYLVASTADASTAPGNVSSVATSRISTKATRSDTDNQRGFASSSTGTSPYVLLNEKTVVSSGVAPGELHVHPAAGNLKNWPVVRFRPPESGYYSGSVVARDLVKASSSVQNANGVDVYLYVADTLVTNANVSLYSYQSTAHFTFDSILMVAGEPVDIVVSAAGEASADGTGISAIFRRGGGDVYDAAKSFFADHTNGGTANLFYDLLGGDAAWRLGAKTNAWCGSQFYAMPTYSLLTGVKTNWWIHSRASSFTEVPSIAMSPSGIAVADSSVGAAADLLAVAPREFVAKPNDRGYQSSSPTLRATVPSNGIYRARANARDLNNGGGDGIRFGIAVAGSFVSASSIVSRETAGCLYETALEGDRLWLKTGDLLEFVVEPNDSKSSDHTGLSACYEKVGDATAQVINIDIAGSGSGRSSGYTGRGREGWGTEWNALHPGAASSAIAKNCSEDDGTKRNVSMSITRSSGAAIATANPQTGCAMLDSAVASTGAGDAYAFTISRLEPNAAYSLYLYGTGDASFTVGGETKGLEEPWCAKETDVLARFDVTADANGEVSGIFSATSASGATFGGLTIVGEFPTYTPPGMMLILR